MKNLLTLFLITLFFHCNAQEIDTKNIEQRDRIYYEIGKEEGQHIWWFENGNIKQKENFNNGIKEGKWEEWDENGKSVWIGNYKDDYLIKANDINLKGLKIAISEILTLASEKNIKKLNEKYIHKDYGIYDVYRVGVPNRFKKLTTIPEKTKGWSIYYTLTTSKNTKQELQEVSTEFDCGNFTWSKEGLFYNKIIINPLLSQIMKYETENEGKKFSKEEIENIQFIEKNSVRIIETASDIIFYLTKIDNAWYITLIDRVTTDCSV